jgi:excisionase family DNA binding protein
MVTSLLTADDVAGLLGVSKDWIYAEVRADRIPHVKLGRSVRFRPASIEEWIASMERGTMGVSTKRRGAAGTAPGMAHEETAS